MRLAGGDPVTLLRKISGGQWSFGVWANDSIIFGTPTTGLRRVSVESGEATDLTTLDAKSEQGHSHPAERREPVAALLVEAAHRRRQRLQRGVRRTQHRIGLDEGEVVHHYPDVGRHAVW